MIKLTPEKPPYYENVAQIKIYIANLTQSGTDNPTAIELINTIGNIIWTRDGVGEYTATLANAFPKLKTTLIGPNLTATGQYPAQMLFNAEDGEPSNKITLKTRDSGGQADEILYDTTLQITVYP